MDNKDEPKIIKMKRKPAVGVLNEPKLYLLALIETALANMKNEHLGEVSMDNDNDSGSLIIDIKSGDEVTSFLISTSSIEDVTNLEDELEALESQ